MASDTHYDDLLYPILYKEGNFYGFFDRIFEFLYRRTDFLKFKKDESPNLGLADGEAEKIVRCAFYKYMKQAVSDERAQAIQEVNHVPPDFIAEETVETTNDKESEEILSPPPEEKSAESKKNDTSVKQPEDLSDVKMAIMDTDSYNGACYEGYSWAQTLHDVDIHLKVPREITSGKQVRVNIQQTHIQIDIIKDGQQSVLKEGDLSWKISVEESTWTLIPGEEIHICLQKMQDRWWESFFVGEPKINLRAIDPTIPYEELDRDSQTKIEELMYNQHLKRLGKPTIQQNKLQNILKDAWGRDGSPFKGQPFDPSIVNIQDSESLPL